jgi:hypothetical protein
MTNDNTNLEDQLLQITARLECSDAAGVTSTGTSFFFHVLSKTDSFAPVLITNRHVVSGMTFATIPLTVEGKALAKRHTLLCRLSELDKRIIDHPDANVDLVAIALSDVLSQLASAGFRPIYCHLNESNIPTDEALREFSPVQDALLIGYPSGIWDPVNNFPVTHKAITATPPYGDYFGRQELLLSAPTFPGSSGSPVFLYDRGGFTDKSGSTHLGARRLAFAGIATETFFSVIDGDVSRGPIATRTKLWSQMHVPANVAVCIKTTALMPLIVSIKERMSRELAA